MGKHGKNFYDWGGLANKDMVTPDLFNSGYQEDNSPGLQQVMYNVHGDRDGTENFLLTGLEFTHESASLWDYTSGAAFLSGQITYIAAGNDVTFGDGYVYLKHDGTITGSASQNVAGCMLGEINGTTFTRMRNGRRDKSGVYTQYNTEHQYFHGQVEVSGLVTMDGNLDVVNDLSVDGTSNLDNVDIDGTFKMDGTIFDINGTAGITIDTTDTTNGIKIGTITSGVPITIGHSTSEVNIGDNMTVSGNIYPYNDGDNLGSTTKRWSLLSDNVKMYGHITSNQNNLYDIGESATKFRKAYLVDLDVSNDATVVGDLTVSGNVDLSHNKLIKSGKKNFPFYGNTRLGAGATLEYNDQFIKIDDTTDGLAWMYIPIDECKSTFDFSSEITNFASSPLTVSTGIVSLQYLNGNYPYEGTWTDVSGSTDQFIASGTMYDSGYSLSFSYPENIDVNSSSTYRIKFNLKSNTLHCDWLIKGLTLE